MLEPPPSEDMIQGRRRIKSSRKNYLSIFDDTGGSIRDRVGRVVVVVRDESMRACLSKTVLQPTTHTNTQSNNGWLSAKSGCTMEWEATTEPRKTKGMETRRNADERPLSCLRGIRLSVCHCAVRLLM